MSLDNQRPRSFLISVMLLVSIGYGIFLIIGFNVNPKLTFGLFAGYLLVASCLIVWLAGRLFRQHEMRMLKFDILAMIIITTMIALPLGFGSSYYQLVVDSEFASTENSRRGKRIVITGLMYFSFLPLLFVNEALMVWTVGWRHRRKQE